MILMFLDLSVWVALAGLAAGELYLLLIRGRPVGLRVAYFLVLTAVWIGYYYFLESPTAAQMSYPRTFAAYVFLICAVPVTLFAIGLELVPRLKSRYLPHVAMGILVFVIALFWPSFAVLMHCGMLECF